MLCLAFVAGLSFLSVRLIQIQLWERKKYADRARAAYDRSEVLPGLRGKIVDRHEEVLAKSISLSTVMVDAKLLSDPVVVVKALAYERASVEEGWDQLSPRDKVRRLKAERSVILEQLTPEAIVSRNLSRAVGVLSRPLGLRKEELRARIEGPMGKGRMYFAIAKDLPEDAADQLRGLIEENHLKGFRFQNTIKRWYTSPDLATHVIGYTGEAKKVGINGKDVFVQVGKFGIEAAMEEYLRGKDGKWDHLNIPMPGEEGTMIPPVHGLNVRLTVDMGLQTIVEEELEAGLKEFKSKRGCVVLLDPKTGELLAMANRPHFNLIRKEGLAEGAMNYALQGTYEPGSTIKIVAASGALNERLVSPETQVFCHNGYFQEGKLVVRDDHPKGMLAVEGILVKSNNIGTFMLARQLGVKRFYDYVNDYGFGKKTGILLSNESSGIARNTNNKIDFSRAAFGYALTVTPLQMASAYGAIANGGELIKPRVIHSIVAGDGTVLQKFKPEVVRRVLRPEASKQMRSILSKVTETGGTATQGAVPGFRVAGKTGTAVRIEKGKYCHGHYTVSFAGMMPAEDPAFVCLVVVDDPMTTEVKRYGGTIAAPIFSRIATRLATQMNLTPTEPIEPEEALVNTAE